ncbi:hypothetical protein Q9S36_33775 [Microbacterium sp. ARD31]|uniref:hypothetical protein n=1 Tax=Microbacterium sp. ARD31 TaxID=2962576 RepID=UPI002881A3E9|nr:hypothetical protein [Microbacterium sp. ARD31]MDT0185164.1 hypothetical protein [Microbacterium sp. ARD31]
MAADRTNLEPERIRDASADSVQPAPGFPCAAVRRHGFPCAAVHRSGLRSAAVH